LIINIENDTEEYSTEAEATRRFFELKKNNAYLEAYIWRKVPLVSVRFDYKCVKKL
jgi:hypothetical protein